ncbi:MAG: HD domain-containing phosphohydrolase [Armatimonadota bacterium]
MQQDALVKAHIMIVDDQEANVRLLERILQQAGFDKVKSTTDPRLALSLFAGFQPDLVLLDLHMPNVDGFQIMEELRHRIEGTYLPILVLTADITPEVKQRALAGGAKDFLTKPVDAIEVVLRIRNLIETRMLHLQLQDQNEVLEEKVLDRTKDLEQAQIEILERLALAAEYRDDDTGQHTYRVGRTSGRIATALALPDAQVDLIRRAAPLHDVGKIGIPDAILLKPAKLTPDEFEVMKTHATIGARILSGSKFPLLQLAREIAFAHHERWDGGGFPEGLAGEAIPLEARIVAVADAYDAMTSNRPYRRALLREEAWNILWDGAGTQWDERVIEAFASSQNIGKEGVNAHAVASGARYRRSPAADPRR